MNYFLFIVIPLLIVIYAFYSYAFFKCIKNKVKSLRLEKAQCEHEKRCREVVSELHDIPHNLKSCIEDKYIDFCIAASERKIGRSSTLYFRYGEEVRCENIHEFIKSCKLISVSMRNLILNVTIEPIIHSKDYPEFGVFSMELSSFERWANR